MMLRHYTLRNRISATARGTRDRLRHLLTRMNRNQTDLRDECPKCGANCYQGGYCFRCGTYRPSKHNERDEELDAAAFVEGGFAHRVSYADDEALLDSDDLDIPNRKHRPQRTDDTPKRKPKKQDIHPRPQPEPGKPPAPRVKRSHLLQRPDLSIPELIELYNRREDGPAIEQLRTDSAHPPCVPQTSAAVGPPSEPTSKGDSPIPIAPEPSRAPTPGLEAPCESESPGHSSPYDIAQPPDALPSSSPKAPKHNPPPTSSNTSTSHRERPEPRETKPPPQSSPSSPPSRSTSAYTKPNDSPVRDQPIVSNSGCAKAFVMNVFVFGIVALIAYLLKILFK
jgi:hypothetical protein